MEFESSFVAFQQCSAASRLKFNITDYIKHTRFSMHLWRTLKLSVGLMGVKGFTVIWGLLKSYVAILHSLNFYLGART